MKNSAKTVPITSGGTRGDEDSASLQQQSGKVQDLNGLKLALEKASIKAAQCIKKILGLSNDDKF